MSLELPHPTAWAQRTKGIAPMPGGYDGYLESLSRVCDLVAEERPAATEFADRLKDLFGISEKGALQRASFLRKVGIVEESGGVCRLGVWASQWHQRRDPSLIVALLHSRCRFIGEMLVEAREPESTEGLREVAERRYGLSWNTQTQVTNRRGWLQSAGMLAPTDDGKLQTTQQGLMLRQELDVHEPADGPVAARAERSAPSEPDELAEVSTHQTTVDALADELRRSALDSTSPDRFERATRDAFAFLGFESEWLGGAGKTDVLAEAALGQDGSYRVIIDCKTSATGSVGDQQIDWVTLGEHKTKHDADYVAVVAPKPSGHRLFERAGDQHVTVVSIEQLIGICRLHARTPLGLSDYRSLFATYGEVNTRVVDEEAESVERLMVLAGAVCTVIAKESLAHGRFSARDVRLLLRDEPVAETTTEAELQVLLDTLASPLLNVLDGTQTSGYRTATTPNVFRMRLDTLAAALTSGTKGAE